MIFIQFPGMVMMITMISRVTAFIGRVVLPAALFVSFAVAASAADDDVSFSDTPPEQLQASLGSLQGRKHNAAPLSAAALSYDELQLYRMLMDYRRERGLPPIPVSPNLSRVAKLHVRDLEANPPSGSCNLHSWSGNGPWKPVCYSGSDSASLMWSKPRELSEYSGNGFEIAAWTSEQMRPGHALSLWNGSPSHNALIVNSGTWERFHWNAVGVAIWGSYAVVWFGEESDVASR